MKTLSREHVIFFFPQEIFFPRIKLNLTFNEQLEILSPYSGWDGIQHKALSLVVLFSLPSPFLPARPLFLSLAITDHDSCRKGLFKSAQDTMKSQPESSKKKSCIGGKTLNSKPCVSWNFKQNAKEGLSKLRTFGEIPEKFNLSGICEKRAWQWATGSWNALLFGPNGISSCREGRPDGWSGINKEEV